MKGIIATLVVFLQGLSLAETLSPPVDGRVPQTFSELWQGYDPRAEPLEVEILEEWEEEGVTLRVVRYRVGVFKGEKAMMAAVYGFPTGGDDLPGLVNIHGGGQYADYRSVLTNAKRGYATISIAWAGRISSPNYRVTPNEVKLFWEGRTDDPGYRVTTDWGALDAYHAPSRNGQDAFVSIPDGSQVWTFDDIPSPRNNSWFLCTMGGRRALTFLEQQPEVDGNKLGVYGHSMGGKLTVLTAGSDDRVKAAAPSCGGISDRYNENPMHRNAVGDSPALQSIGCPTIFLMPSNDFHGHINDLVVATRELRQNPWRVTCSPHLNHRDAPEYEVATQLWFDQHLMGTFSWPSTPTMAVPLKTGNQVPAVHVHPDTGRPVVAVDVFYTQQGHEGGDRNLRENRMSRFWHHAGTTQRGKTWTAEVPLYSDDLPLWVYANVTYALDEPVSGAGYYYGDYTAEQFVVSSLIQLITPERLQEAEVRPTMGETMMIETFGGDWEKHWYSHNQNPSQWEYRTHKVYHPMWKAPEGAGLTFDVRTEKANTMVFGIDGYAAEVKLKGGGGWETVHLSFSSFSDALKKPLETWSGIKELRLLSAEHLRGTGPDGEKVNRLVGKAWNGPNPQFRNLRWNLEANPDSVDLGPMMPREEDWTAMWWRDGFPGKTEGADWRRIVQTGRYWFMLDTDTMKVARLGASTDGTVGSVKGADLELTMTVEGENYRCVRGGEWSKFEGPRLIESGRFLQRADVTDLVFEADDGSRLNVDARFETAAWPDRLGMILAARPGIRPIDTGELSFGRVGGGYGLTGQNELIIPGSESMAGGEFSLEFWAFVPGDYQLEGKASPWLVCKEFHEQFDGNYGIVLFPGAIPEVRMNIGGGRENMYRARAEKADALKMDRWNHLVITYDGNHLRLWVNGKNAAEEEIGKAFVPGNGALGFGNRTDNAGEGLFRYHGVIDQIRLYGQPLAEGQVRHLQHHPEAGLPHLEALREWSFDAEGIESMERISEQWSSVSMELTLTGEKGEIMERWALPEGQPWNRDTWHEAGFSMDPVNFTRLPDGCELRVEAKELATGGARPVTYDSTVGWHRINLDKIRPIPASGGEDPGNDSIERIQLFLANPTSDERTARLMFEKTRSGFEQRIGVPITGVSAMLRDREGNPTGIPVQLSKNWHSHPEDDNPYTGQWFHGISQVHLPPVSELELELTLAYGHWGGVAAASHAQLSLIGWGGNQRWDQSALGSWGESICYSPEQNETGCTITDVRPLMVTSMQKESRPWQWTKNVGGGDFLRIFDVTGERIPRSGIVVDYRRQCPCFTEVLYSGGMKGAGIHHSQWVSLGRTDDLVCGTYQISMRVVEPVDFSRFAIFQVASDNYATTRESKLAVGDANGLISEWDARWGGNAYRGESLECIGRNPWVSLHQTEGNPGEEGKPGAWANRGFVIRQWKAKLGGEEVNPWIAEYGLDRRGGFQTSLMEVVPPPGLKRLEVGDFIEATIEHLVIPQHAEDYYGPNESLRAALEKDGDSWKMVHRQVQGDELAVSVSTGKLQRVYPDVRIAAVGGKADFTLSGGLGYVPITFVNLDSHGGYTLSIDGREVDQSMHGNDFWQTDFDSANGKWSRTYNIRTAPGKTHSIRFTRQSEVR